MISRPESARSRVRSTKSLNSVESSNSAPSSPSPAPDSANADSQQQQQQQQQPNTSPPRSGLSSRQSSKDNIKRQNMSMASSNRSQNSIYSSADEGKSDGEESFNEDEDILEFRAGDVDPSIMKSVDTATERAPVVVRHRTTSNMDFSTDDQTPPPPPPERTTSEPVLPSAHSHQTALFGTFGKPQEKLPDVEEVEWQDMKTVASYEVYDDRGNLVVHRHHPGGETDDEGEEDQREQHQSASKGYTRVTVDDDVKSIASIDEKADYLFDEDELNRDPLKQLQATKDMLTMSQRIAYVGLSKLVTISMAQDLAKIKASKKVLKVLTTALESLNMWSQQMMVRLYSHMEISQDEQIMIEQLAEHGVLPSDLSPSLKQAARVKNPMGKDETEDDESQPEQVEMEQNAADHFNVQKPEDLEGQDKIDIDIRWTLLCDLFLVLISDSIYDARSRTLLERVAQELGISQLEVAQFERKVTDALEIEDGGVQNWDESGIMEDRRKAALKKKYAYVGLATLGGGLVIGLSAGLLAPVIGAGLAAGFTTIGVTGTGSFLAGAGGAAVVTTTGAVAGAGIGSRGMTNRMGHVKTFEFRPLHNNNRVNAIITVSGWMLGKEDDVRLPFSTVDPIMGDLFSVLWEPEMLQSMGTTINILATEVLVQSIQHVLGQTVLTALMASLQLPLLLSKLSYLLDNPWNVSLDRAWSAGLILADSLINRNLGTRPVTLVGFSLGARLIYSCLVELSRRGAHGLVQDVFIFGAPFAVKQDQFAAARSVVSGRFVNGFSRKDWILGYLFRATSGGLGRVAGLAPVEIVGDVENFECTDLVDGHMGYRRSIPKLLKEAGFEVVSEEFTEIEDPDPEREREKQRELKQELEDARKKMNEEASKLEAQSKKKGMFSWLKPKRKEWWENTEGGGTMGDAEVSMQEGNVMFDLGAIQQEVDKLQAAKEEQPGFDKDAIVPGTSPEEKKKEKPTQNDQFEIQVLPGTHPGIEMKDEEEAGPSSNEK